MRPQVLAALLLASVGLLALSCGMNRIDMVFTKANFNQQQFGKDRYECMVKHDSEQKFQACMEAKEYVRTK